MSSSSDECEEICPTPDTNAGKNEHLLPEKSRERYIATYENFITWQNEKNTSSFCEEVLMAYFEEIANKYKPTSLWAIYSMLKPGLKSNHGVNMEEYVSLSVFLKKLSKGYVCKKAKTLTIENVEKFIEEAPDDKYLATKVALILGVTGGLRRQELSEITTNDIENHGEVFLIKVPHTKNRIQRSFVIQGKYYNIVKKYQSLRTAKKGVSTRFFQQFRNGKCNAQVIGRNKFGMMPREIAEFLNLPDAKDYTGHSFRKAFTTQDLGAKFNLSRQVSNSSVPETYTDESFNDTNMELADQCRFCGQFSKDCVTVSTHTPYLSGHRTTLALNDTSVQLDFNGALPNTVCQDCDAKLQEIADFVKVVKDAQELINGKIKTECDEDNDMTEIDDFIKTERDAINSISISDTVFIKSVSHKIKSDTNQKAKVSKPNVMVQCASDVDIKQEIDEDLESSRLSHSDTHADSGVCLQVRQRGQTSLAVPDSEPNTTQDLLESPPLDRDGVQCRFCGQFSNNCVAVSAHMPYLAGHKTALALNHIRLELDFSNYSLPKTVCRNCNAKLHEICEFVKQVNTAQFSLVTVSEKVNKNVEFGKGHVYALSFTEAEYVKKTANKRKIDAKAKNNETMSIHCRIPLKE